ncbi:NADP-dependent oxidoreductase domain-containing protein 1 [Osmerus mordax]|uniref:NADP-dependent oxidoreductase domain-containing protein 1 n=1 Tax=Osmerus mordax TaxID=8014 RepID=UPI003510D1BC
MMLDFTVNLKTLGFECGLSENEKEYLFLRARSAGLSICGCAHAAFVCKLANSLRKTIQRRILDQDVGASIVYRPEMELTVGILGGGNLGKQLAHVLLEKTGIKPSQINISTRRPETLEGCVKLGIKCYFDNRRLVAWAHLLFLCCLPSQVTKVCAEICSHVPKHCLVYSFTSAVHVKRLAQILGHGFILKPQYEFGVCDWSDVYLSHSHLTQAVKDPKLVESSCPLTMSGGLSLNPKWVSGLFYSLLNICTNAQRTSAEALELINSLFKLKESDTAKFTQHSYVCSSYASSLSPDEPFPWINLIDAQTKETPLSIFITRNKAIQECISVVYKQSLAGQEH